MAAISKVELPNYFDNSPEDLASIAVPYNEGFIPVMTVAKFEQKMNCTITKLGNGAVTMSLGEPFGFMCNFVNYTPQVPSIKLMPASKENIWEMELETDEPLTLMDKHLFSLGIGLYYNFAINK